MKCLSGFPKTGNDGNVMRQYDMIPYESRSRKYRETSSEDSDRYHEARKLNIEF